MFALPAPCPLSLYKNENLFPARGASSTISFSSMSAPTASKSKLVPFITLLKL